MENLLNDVQSYIDENKHSVKEFDYINICNTMKELFHKNTSPFYKVKYIKPVIISHSNQIFSVDMKQKEMIIKLQYKSYEKIKDVIDTYGTFSIDITSCNGMTEPFNKYFLEYHKHYIECCECDEETSLIIQNKTIILTHIENA